MTDIIDLIIRELHIYYWSICIYLDNNKINYIIIAIIKNSINLLNTKKKVIINTQKAYFP